MSNYKDYIKELPRRIKKLVEYHYELESKQQESMETTLLISFAMPLLCITGERLRKSKESIEIRSQLQDQKISDLGWFCNNLTENVIIGKTDYIDQLRNGKPLITSERKIFRTLSIFRNALAHGNIQFEPCVNSDQIQNIVFSSYKSANKHEDGYDYCKISVNEFKQLILNICDYLIRYKFNAIALAYNIEEMNNDIENAA